MNEFTKTKIHFVLALLGSLFALHPFLQRYEDAGFRYLGYELRLSYAYAAFAGLLALAVYFYGLTLLSERPHSGLERLGNYAYALAVMILPLFGALYLSSLFAVWVGESRWAWAAPGVALALGVGWLLLSQLLAWALRGRLVQQDRYAKIEQLAKQEIASLNHAHELFEGEHYDLSVMEVWRAVEARLRRVLLARGIAPRQMDPGQVVRAAGKAGLIQGATPELLEQLQRTWRIAISSEPLDKKSADVALGLAQQILATIAVEHEERRHS